MLRLPQLLEIVPLSKRRIDQLEEAGEFPARVALGANAIAWVEAEVREWLAARVGERVRPQGARAEAPVPTPAPRRRKAAAAPQRAARG
jgi:prophage regulatory protein